MITQGKLPIKAEAAVLKLSAISYRVALDEDWPADPDEMANHPECPVIGQEFERFDVLQPLRTFSHLVFLLLQWIFSLFSILLPSLVFFPLFRFLCLLSSCFFLLFLPIIPYSKQTSSLWTGAAPKATSSGPTCSWRSATLSWRKRPRTSRDRKSTRLNSSHVP